MEIDFTFVWTWFLLFARMSGLLVSLPGLGTDEVPLTFRGTLSLVLSAAVTSTATPAQIPESLAAGGLMIAAEIAIGYLLGAIPFFIVGSLAVAGHVTSATIGLSQATLIDPSIGEHVSTLGRLQSLMAVCLFLIVDGHHVILEAAMNTTGDAGLGLFRPNSSTATILIGHFSHVFELAVIASGPILVAVLVTQFVLGLLTKFVPQVNVFIVSMPLTIGIGLFLAAYTLPTLGELLRSEFLGLQELANAIMTSTALLGSF